MNLIKRCCIKLSKSSLKNILEMLRCKLKALTSSLTDADFYLKVTLTQFILVRISRDSGLLFLAKLHCNCLSPRMKIKTKQKQNQSDKKIKTKQKNHTKTLPWNQLCAGQLCQVMGPARSVDSNSATLHWRKGISLSQQASVANRSWLGVGL